MMKKWWILLLLLLPCLAFAEPEHMPYAAALDPAYGRMSTVQQTLYDAVYDALWAGDALIPLPEGTSYDDASLVLAAIRRSCAELCLARDGFSIAYLQHQPEKAVSIRWHPDDTQLQEDRAMLQEETASLLAELPEEKASAAEAIASWLCERLTYTADLPEAQYTPQEAMRSGRAKCLSYAGLYAYLCRMAGIPCEVMEGEVNGARHAWNYIWVDGTAQLADLTARDAGILLPEDSYHPDQSR